MARYENNGWFVPRELAIMCATARMLSNVRISTLMTLSGAAARVGVFERGASNFEDLCLAAGAQFRDEVGLRLNQDAGLRALAWIIGADVDEIALIFPKNAATRRIS